MASKLRWTRLESMRLQCGSSEQTGGTYPRRCTHRKRTSKSPNKMFKKVLFGGRGTSGMANDDVASAWFSSPMRYPNNSKKALTQARLPRVLSQPPYRAVTCSCLWLGHPLTFRAVIIHSISNKLSEWGTPTTCLLVLNVWSPTLSDPPALQKTLMLLTCDRPSRI